MLGWLGFLAGGAFGAYDIASVEVTRPHPSLERVVYNVDAGDSPLDRFSIIHVSKRGAGRGCSEPVILLVFGAPPPPSTLAPTPSFVRTVEADVYFDVHWKRTFLDPFTRWLRRKI